MKDLAQSLSKNRTSVALAAILLLATVLRFSFWGVFEFKLDEVGVLSIALGIARAKKLPVVGYITSVGLPDGVLIPYIWSPTLLLSNQPNLTFILAILLNLLAVLGTYFFITKFFHPRVALIATLFYAISPWAVVFSRKIWTQNLPCLQILLLLTIYLWAIDKRTWALTLSLALLALQFQAHIMAFILLPSLLLTLLLFRHQVRPRPLLLGLGASILILAPYGTYLLSHYDGILQSISASPVNRDLVLDTQAIQHALGMASGLDLAGGLGAAAYLFQPHGQLLAWITPLVGLLILLGLLLSGATVIRRGKGSSKHILLLLWFVCPILSLTWHSAPIYRHYLMNLYPLQFIFMAFAIDGLLRRSRALAALAIITSGIVVIAQVWSLLAFFPLFDGYGMQGGFGLAYKHWHAIATKARQEASTLGVKDVAVITEGTDRRVEVWPGVLAYLLEPDLTLRFLGRGGTSSLLLSQHIDRLYVVTREDNEVSKRLRDWGTSLGRITVGQNTAVSYYALMANSPENQQQLPQVRMDISFENGVHFTGYDAPTAIRPGDTFPLLTYWEFSSVDDEDRGGYWQVFVHLVDSTQRRWGQQDAFGIDSTLWANGDLFLQWYELVLPNDMPTGEYWLLIGFYSLWDGRRAPTLDEAGRPMDDHIRLGPWMLDRFGGS